MDVGLEPGTKGLHGHDDPRSGFLALVSSVSVASDLSGGPPGKDSVNRPAYLAMQSGVELKAFAQTHLMVCARNQTRRQSAAPMPLLIA